MDDDSEEVGFREPKGDDFPQQLWTTKTRNFNLSFPPQLKCSLIIYEGFTFILIKKN